MLGKRSISRTWSETEAIVFDPSPWMDEVMRYAYFRLGNREDAEDVAAQVMHIARSAAGAEDPRAYMLGIARRKVADVLRWRQRTRWVPLVNRSIGPKAFADAVHRREDVARVLRGLSDDHREALVLKYVLEMSAQEIAEITGRTPQAVHSLLQRARTAFAEGAGAQFEEENS